MIVSAGGNVVLLYASKYKDIHTVVNISGRFNLARGMESRLGENFIQRIKQDGFIDVKNKRGELRNIIIRLFVYHIFIYHLGITQISMSWSTFSCFFVHLLP